MKNTYSKIWSRLAVVLQLHHIQLIAAADDRRRRPSIDGSSTTIAIAIATHRDV
jgi:hypothetical protein